MKGIRYKGGLNQHQWKKVADIIFDDEQVDRVMFDNQNEKFNIFLKFDTDPEVVQFFSQRIYEKSKGDVLVKVMPRLF